MQSPSHQDSIVPAQFISAAKLLSVSHFSPTCSKIDALHLADLLAAAGHREAAARLLNFAYDLLAENTEGCLPLIASLFADETGESAIAPRFGCNFPKES